MCLTILLVKRYCRRLYCMGVDQITSPPALVYTNQCSISLIHPTLDNFTRSLKGNCLHELPSNNKLSKNAIFTVKSFSYIEPFLRAVNGARRGALAKSITGYHKNMVRKQYPVLELANQMPVRIWIWPEPLVAPRVRRALGTRML